MAEGPPQSAVRESIEQLQATLSERAQVIEMADSGISGPYVFEESVWKDVDLVEGFDPL